MYEIFSGKLRLGSTFVICLYSCFLTMKYWVLLSTSVCLVTKLYTSLCDPIDWGTQHLCPWDFPSKNTGVGCYFHLKGVFLTQELNSHLLCLLHWQVGSLPLSHLGSPLETTTHTPTHKPWPDYAHSTFELENKHRASLKCISFKVILLCFLDCD